MECAVMGQRFHRGFTAAEKTELWDRWKRGESLKAIGRAFGKHSSSIYFLVAPHGGIRPAQRRRSRLALTLAEREVICRGVTSNVVADLSQEGFLDKLAEVTNDLDIGLVVSNAGTGNPGEFLKLDRQLHQTTLRISTMASGHHPPLRR